MSEKKTSPKWLEKLKKIKHIELYIAVIFVIILLLIYLSNFQSGDSARDGANNTNEITITAYVDKLESDLEVILSNIGGVSDVKVLITLDMNQMEVSESIINLNKFPTIKGVLVTAKGVNDTSKKLKVLHAIQAVVDLKNGNVEILSSD